MASSDPFRTPDLQVPTTSRGKLDLVRIVKFVLDSPQWISNILWTALGVIFSGMVVGLLIIHGYQMDIVMAEHGSVRRRYPDFDMNRIADYLLRGLWVWLAVMVCSIVIGMLLSPFLIAAIIFFALLFGIEPNGGPGIEVSIVIGLISAFFSLLINGLMMIAVVPIILRVGLTGDFGELFNWRWHLDFIKRTFWSLLGGTLFLTLIIAMYMFFGLALCCIGLVPAFAWFYLSQAQFFSQIYGIYLQRGGTPITIVPLGNQTIADTAQPTSPNSRLSP